MIETGWRSIALCVLSAFATALPLFYEHLFFLPWVSLVPLIYLVRGTSAKGALLFGLLWGFCFCAIATYWLVPFLRLANGLTAAKAIVAASAYWCFSGFAVAIIAVVTRWVSHRESALVWLAFALVGTSLFAHYPQPFPADLSLTQGYFLPALQGLDITGSLGLHFCILLHNGLLQDFLQRRKAGFAMITWLRSAGVILLIGWFGYGFYCLQQNNAAARSIRVGVVQTNTSVSIRVPAVEPGFSRAYPPALALSQALVAHQPAFIVWPETGYAGFADYPHVQRAFSTFVENNQTPLLFQELQREGSGLYNTSVLLAGEGSIQRYRKHKLIPFGEYLPSGFPVLLTKLIFGDFVGDLTPGQNNPVFALPDVLIQPLVCYESAQRAYVAQLLNGSAEKPHLLVVQSNDGWFGDSIQVNMHLVTGQLRGVEHRLPVLHAINNGPSWLTDPTGQRLFTTEKHLRAGYLFDVDIGAHTSPSWYARHPQLFGHMVDGLLAVMAIWILIAAFMAQRKRRIFPPDVSA